MVYSLCLEQLNAEGLALLQRGDRIERQVEETETFTAPRRRPKSSWSMPVATRIAGVCGSSARAVATRSTCRRAVAGVISGSRPEAEAVTASAGTEPPPSALRYRRRAPPAAYIRSARNWSRSGGGRVIGVGPGGRWP